MTTVDIVWCVMANNVHQNDKIKRGFKLTHQKLVLDIDIDGKTVSGHTELILQPQTRKLRTEKVKLNCRQCFVTSVLVNNVETKFQLKNFMEMITSNPETRDLDTYNAFSKAANHYSDEGELIVDIPPQVVFFKEGVNEQQRSIVQFSPLHIIVNYRLINPQGGLIFVEPDQKNHPLRLAHMYSYQQPEGARLWFPTCDQLYEKCTWELELTANSNLVVIASGQLLEKVCNEDETKNTFIYRQDVPTCASSIGICVGPFEIYPDPYLSNVTHFCLPHKLNDLKHSVQFLHHVYHYYEEYLGSPFPYSSYKQVFVEDNSQVSSSYTTLTILNTHLLHGSEIIDQTFETRKIIAHAISKQWFSLHLSPKFYSDMWLFFGLSGYLTHQFIKKHFGFNDYRYQLIKDEEYVAQYDNGTVPPLYYEHYAYPIEVFSELNIKKSPLVIYMIEKRITEDGVRKLLNNLLNNQSASSSTTANNSNNSTTTTTAITSANGSSTNLNKSLNSSAIGVQPMDVMINQSTSSLSLSKSQSITESQTISTSSTTTDTFIQSKKFLKLIKTITGQDLKLFAEKWIFGKGCPQLVCGFNFNRKKFQTEFALKQIYNKPDEKISSNLTIRITELDGTYDHHIMFEDDIFEHDYPCNSRCRKSKKKKLLAGDGEEMEIDLSTKRDTPLLWIRIDPELEWIHKITFRQPEYMWIHQLELDRDVIGQIEAIKGLKDFITGTAIKAAFKFFSNSKYFYKVRQDAAILIAKLSCKETNFEGLDLLIKYFQTNFYDIESNQLAPNDFQDFSSYFIRKTIPMAVSLMKDREGRTPMEGIEFLLALLKDNNNSLNKYSDNYYLESLILAISNVHTTNQSHIKKLVKQVNRYLKFDQLYPSFKNTVTQSCLKALCEFQCSKMIPLDFQVFKNHLQYSNFEEVRKIALQCIYTLYYQFSSTSSQNALAVKNYSLTDYMLELFENESSLMIKHHIINMLSSPPTATMDERAYRSLLKDDIKLVDRLWSYLNSSITSMDFSLKAKVMKFYRFIWDKSTPNIFLRRLKSIKLHPSGNSSGSNIKVKNPSSSTSSSASKESSRHRSSSSSKKRKNLEDQQQFTSEQPLKIHIKLSDSSVPTNNTASHHSSDHHHQREHSSHSHHSSSHHSSNHENLKKIIDENDMNDPDLKAFLELKERSRHRDSHRKHHRDRSYSNSSNGSNGQGDTENTTIVENDFDNPLASLPKDIKMDLIENEEEYRKDLEIIGDLELKSREKDRRSKSHHSHHSSSHHRDHSSSSSHRDHSSSSHHRDRDSHSSHREHSSSSSHHRDRETHSSGHSSSGSNSHRRRDSHSSSSSSHREHREHREKSSSTSTNVSHNSNHFPMPVEVSNNPLSMNQDIDILNSIESEKRPMDEQPLPVQNTVNISNNNSNHPLKLPIKIKISANSLPSTPVLNDTPTTPQLDNSNNKIVMKNPPPIMQIENTEPESSKTDNNNNISLTPTTEKPKFILRLSLGNNTLTKQI